MARSTVHYADSTTNNLLKKLHNKLRPAGTPVQRVEYIIELLLLRLFEVKLRQDPDFKPLIPIFKSEDHGELLFSSLLVASNDDILPRLNTKIFPFYGGIVAEARKVLKGNPPAKLQDQLVLLEEVFGSSNFTSAVQSGNMREVLDLVAQIDEHRILKSDLLGDAVESALSETGGTKDLGLFRTPDHIRQFMVGLVQPRIDDELLDPAAGTGGFMFDAYEYVMQGVARDESWPGQRAHPELAAWFKKHFAARKAAMPSAAQTTDFYRRGVMGIEYLGVIRKMAAVNFYIRGLNPANILKGDSLALFKKEYHPETKSAILANPPFGAERDQESYPDVWADYPRESETTILFVKLMLETLKKHGRCAVVVSEGFMTWDQNSARALRLELLQAANLRAIISLPQGIFVSKGGQGPKTSILYFEKGEPTRAVWYYKVTNDGYTMGTTRKPQPGCQLVEALDLFHGYVAKGKTPPESRHAFSIPTEWIRQVDPRVKDRIREETCVEITQKAAEDRAKLVEKLDTRIAAGKLTAAERDDQLAEHALAWENKLHATIAQRIEREHLYSLNLPNHRGSLTPEQRAAWDGLRTAAVAERGSLDELWGKLKKADLDELPDLLTQLDPSSALQLDIARSVLAARDAGELAKAPQLKALAEALAQKTKTPRVKLGDVLTLRREIVEKDDYDGQTELLGKIRFSDGKVFRRDEKTTASNLQVAEYGDLLVSKINFHQGATGINDYGRLLASLDYLVYKVNAEVALPRYVFHVLRSPQFLAEIEANRPGGIKGRSQPDFIEQLSIPLPALEQQNEFVGEVDRQFAIEYGAELLGVSWRISPDLFIGTPRAIREFAEIGTGTTPPRANSEYFGGDVPWALTSEVDHCVISDTKEKLTSKAVDDCGLRIYPRDTVLVAMYGQGKTRGKSAILGVPAAITQNCGAVIITDPDVVPAYVYLYLRAIYEEIRGQEYSGGGVPHLNLGIIGSIRVPLPSREEQEAIVSDLSARTASIDGLQKLANDAVAAISKQLHKLWTS
jgi:type I restriction-modification system DNA methylase subunit/restriction endonuclease S subunit